MWVTCACGWTCVLCVDQLQTHTLATTLLSFPPPLPLPPPSLPPPPLPSLPPPLPLSLPLSLPPSPQGSAGGVQQWRVNPEAVQRCVADVVKIARELDSDESRYFRAVSCADTGTSGNVCMHVCKNVRTGIGGHCTVIEMRIKCQIFLL